MRCDNCGNHGVRNNEYCTCPYGSSKKVSDGNYQMSPKLQAIMDKVMEQHGGVLKRLGEC